MFEEYIEEDDNSNSIVCKRLADFTADELSQMSFFERQTLIWEALENGEDCTEAATAETLQDKWATYLREEEPLEKFVELMKSDSEFSWHKYLSQYIDALYYFRYDVLTMRRFLPGEPWTIALCCASMVAERGHLTSCGIICFSAVLSMHPLNMAPPDWLILDKFDFEYVLVYDTEFPIPIDEWNVRVILKLIQDKNWPGLNALIEDKRTFLGTFQNELLASCLEWHESTDWTVPAADALDDLLYDERKEWRDLINKLCARKDIDANIKEELNEFRKE